MNHIIEDLFLNEDDKKERTKVIVNDSKLFDLLLSEVEKKLKGQNPEVELVYDIFCALDLKEIQKKIETDYIKNIITQLIVIAKENEVDCNDALRILARIGNSEEKFAFEIANRLLEEKSAYFSSFGKELAKNQPKVALYFLMNSVENDFFGYYAHEINCLEEKLGLDDFVEYFNHKKVRTRLFALQHAHQKIQSSSRLGDIKDRILELFEEENDEIKLSALRIANTLILKDPMQLDLVKAVKKIVETEYNLDVLTLGLVTLKINFSDKILRRIASDQNKRNSRSDELKILDVIDGLDSNELKSEIARRLVWESICRCESERKLLEYQICIIQKGKNMEREGKKTDVIDELDKAITLKIKSLRETTQNAEHAQPSIPNKHLIRII